MLVDRLWDPRDGGRQRAGGSLVVVAVAGISMGVSGTTDQLPNPRSLIGVAFLLSAVLAHVGLYSDIRAVRTTNQG